MQKIKPGVLKPSPINIEVSSFNPTQRKPVEPKLEYKDQYLTFKALENCEIRIIVMSMSWQQVFSVSYSINNGKSWNLLEINYDMVVNNELPTISLQKGKTVLLKSIHGVSLRFKSSGKYDVYGNIMSLLHGDDFKNKIEIDGHPFAEFFRDETKLINAKNLILPKFTNNSYNCYAAMFFGCTSLISAPALPATTLAHSCYSSMFAHCTSLKNAPILPATNLHYGCYSSMFWDCTSLINPPKLPATSVLDYSYKSMFSGCTSLKTPPELPATNLSEQCYEYMFKGCISLTTIPQLPSTTLKKYCYSHMFNGCTSLTTANILPATTLANYCYYNMFQSCTSLINAPQLPATNLTEGCYCQMFEGCRSLINAPILPAINLKRQCYMHMFYNCSNLNYVKALFISAPSGYYINECVVYWLNGVSSTGTFIKNPNATWDTNSEEQNIIPDGWTIETATS